jgi:hypothetical protein
MFRYLWIRGGIFYKYNNYTATIRCPELRSRERKPCIICVWQFHMWGQTYAFAMMSHYICMTGHPKLPYWTVNKDLHSYVYIGLADHSDRRGLRHEPSSPARTLGSSVRIPLEAWLSLCVYSCVCVVLYVGSGLATGWSPVQGVLPTVYRVKKVKKRPRPKGLYRHR